MMRKSIACLLAAASLMSVAIAISEEVRAQTKYPWCTVGGREGGGTNCGFVSFEQCLAAARGTGASCSENPDYQAPKQPAKKPAKR